MPTTLPDIVGKAGLIVVKIGSVLLIDVERGLKKAWLAALAEDVAALRIAGKAVVVVTSGSIAMGRKAMGISATDRPSSIPLEVKQAAAATGQVALMSAYAETFGQSGMAVAQVLVTPRDTEERKSHLNARATIHALLRKGIVPVVNENDTVSTAEIRFGDNDRLASRVAQMIGADLVIQLSTTDGLYTADPRLDPKAQHVPLVESLSQDIVAMAGDAVAGLSTGGMKSKVEAARIATSSGVHMAIGKGAEPHALREIVAGTARVTIFFASDIPLTARKRWILAHVRTSGKLILDDGAKVALLGGKSLLPAGVREVAGAFERGDAVTLHDPNGVTIGTGLCAYDSDAARKIIGRNSHDIPDILGYTSGEELIHRDDLVLAV